LGGYEFEEHAAEAYDIAALKSKGRRTKTNFELTKYSDLLGCINRMTMEELIMAVRRQSQGFSRGTSSFRGVTHHPSGRWEARIGVPGAKHVYLGLFSQEKEAAQAYDRALVRLKGKSASTNFALGDYRKELGDFHRMQSRVLRNDSKFQELSNSPAAFEHWIKNGSEAFPELDSPDMDADLPEDYLQNIPEVQPVADGFRGVSHPIDQFAPLGPAAVAVQEAAAVQKAAETANGSHIDVIYQSSEQTSQGEYRAAERDVFAVPLFTKEIWWTLPVFLSSVHQGTLPHKYL
jgi:AP2-like factor (euAP2 lineage)